MEFQPSESDKMALMDRRAAAAEAKQIAQQAAQQERQRISEKELLDLRKKNSVQRLNSGLEYLGTVAKDSPVVTSEEGSTRDNWITTSQATPWSTVGEGSDNTRAQARLVLKTTSRKRLTKRDETELSAYKDQVIEISYVDTRDTSIRTDPLELLSIYSSTVLIRFGSTLPRKQIDLTNLDNMSVEDLSIIDEINNDLVGLMVAEHQANRAYGLENRTDQTNPTD